MPAAATSSSGQQQEVVRRAVLFADICGSTGWFELLGDQRAQLLVDGVLEAMTRVVERQGGRVVKRLGDAVLAAFGRARSCLLAAEEIHGQVPQAVDWSGEMPPLALHSGAHWGRVIPVEGDIYGDAVNVAARLADLAGPGQILTSEQTVRALEPERQTNTRFVTCLNLRGRKEEIRVYEILWDTGGLTVLSPLPLDLSPARRGSLCLELGGLGLEVNRDRPQLSMGRGPGNDLVLDRAWVSRAHARVELRGRRFVLVDFSSNGTFLQPRGGGVVYVKQDEITLQGSGIITLGRPPGPPNPDQISYRRMT